MIENQNFDNMAQNSIAQIDEIIKEEGDLEALATVTINKINDNSPFQVGRDLWGVYKENSQATDAVLIALTGWSMKSLLILSGLIEDDEGVILP